MTNSIRSQVFVNLGFVFVKSISLLLGIWAADRWLTAGAMGVLLLFRRQGALWGNLLQLGFSQSLQRFYLSNSDSASRAGLWSNLNCCVFVLSLIAILGIGIFATSVSESIFGLSNAALGIAFGIYTAGLALGYMAGSSWMVEFRFIQANVVDWLNSSFLFFICVLVGSKLSDTNIACWLAALTFSVSCVSLFWFAFNFVPKSVILKDWKVEKTVALYGLTRGFTAFADMATLVIGPWLLRNESDRAGYLIISYNVLRLAQTLIMPIAQVLALRANSYRHNQCKEEWRIFWLSVMSFVVGTIAVAVYFVVGEGLVKLWLPNSYMPVNAVLGRLIVFVPALCLFYSLRNYIELRFIMPWNLIVILISIVALVVGYAISYKTQFDAVIFGSQIMLTVLFIAGLVYLSVLYLRIRAAE